MNLPFNLLAPDPALYFPLVLVAKATLLLAVAAVVTLLLHRTSAATRHLVWSLGLSGLLVLPLLSLVVPGWAVPLLPGSFVNPVPTATWNEPRVIVPPAMTESGPATAAALAPAPIPVRTPPTRLALPALTWTTGLFAAWLLGVLLVLVRLALGWWGVRRLARRAQPVTTSEWMGLLRDLCCILDVNVPVRLLRCERATMPMTWGTLRPVVLLPADADAWPAERRRVVLLHELAHVARRDCFTQGFASFACALYWFHPGVWYAARRLRVEREQACDDRVLAAGTRAAEYAGHLLEVARRFRSVGLAGAAAVAMARPSQLEGRLLAVLDPVRSRWEMGRRGRIGAGVATLALIVPLAALQAATRAPLPYGQQASSAAQAEVRDRVIERRFAARPGQMLRLNLGTGGSVRVEGWERNEVWVRAELDGRDWRDTRVEFVEYPDGLEVGSRDVGSRLNASTEHKFQLHVPHRVNLDLRSAGGGIALTEVQGNFAGNTGGGPLNFTRVRGEAKLATGGGPITISDSHLDGEVRTGGGSASIQRTTGDVKVRSESGDVIRGNTTLNSSSSNGSSVPSSEVVRMHRERGDINISRAPAGAEVFTAGGAITIGTSGGAVRAQTGGGAIRVRSAVGLVKLGTGGGAITVDAVDGGIAATTGAGAVVATMVGDPARGDRGVEIRSGSGAVVLTLPDGIGAIFDIEAAYQGSGDNGRTGSPVRITSDFPLQQTQYANPDGTGYRVRATGRVGNGRNRVYIRTVGDVRIRRASGRVSAQAVSHATAAPGSACPTKKCAGQGLSRQDASAGFAFATGSDAGERRRAVKALARNAPPQAALAALTRFAWEDPQAEVQREAVEMLVDLPDDLGMKELIRIAQRHTGKEARRGALQGLSVKACDDAIATLLAVIERDQDTSIQREAVTALSATYAQRRDRQDEIRGMLERITRTHPNAAVRARAALELQELGAAASSAHSS